MDINYQYGFFVDITPNAATPTYAEVSEGINNFEKTMNETVKSFNFLSGQGWGSTEVTGGQLQVKFTGDRVRGDAAQDFIYDPARRYSFGDTRKTRFKITSPGGYAVTGQCTLAKVDSKGGDSDASTAITFEVHFNGKPVITPGMGALNIVSEEGTTTGKTKIFVNPMLSVGSAYSYKTGASVQIPDYGTIPTGFTTWDGVAEITATSGDMICLCEISASTGKAIKAGTAIITSKA